MWVTDAMRHYTADGRNVSDLVVPKIVITEFFKGEKPLRTDLESERF